jgi:formylglycine-generating enzyme required for sulfatase activity
MGFALAQAQSWLAKRPEVLPEADREFITLSRTAAQRVHALVAGLVALIGLLGVGFVYREVIVREVMGQYHWRMVMGPSVLTVEDEKKKAATPGPDSAFVECKKGCPVMIVVPAGKFMMGSPESESDRSSAEGPQHPVTIAKPFAVSKFEVTFEEWDACAAAAELQTCGDAGRCLRST